MAAKLIDWLTK